MQFLISYHERRSTKLTWNRLFDRFDTIKDNLTCKKISIEIIELLLLGFGCICVKDYRNRLF